MASQNATPKQTGWQAASLRATMFYSGRLDVSQVKWAETLTGRPSDARTVLSNAGQLFEVTTIDERAINLQIQLGRIDWLLSSKQAEDSGAFSLIGDFTPAAEYFSQFISRWLPQAPPLIRLGFGAQLILPTTSQPESMKVIAGILTNISNDWTNVRDFIFQLNKPIQCETVPSIGLINRLAKWQTVVRKKIVASISSEGPAGVLTSGQDAAYFEVDISTPVADEATPQVLPRNQIESLFQEIVGRGSEIISNGNTL